MTPTPPPRNLYPLLRILLAAVVAVMGIALSEQADAGSTTFVVDSTDDDDDANPGDGSCATGGSVCTFRAAIQEANAGPNTNAINFGLTGGAPHTITPETVLPAISNPATIDGRTQAGYTNSPVVHLDGGALSEGMGLYLQASDSTIAGLRITGFPDNAQTPLVYGAQILVNAAGNANIVDNVLGIDQNGAAVPDEYGIWADHATNLNIEGNVIGGAHRDGIFLDSATGGTLTQNLIGLNPAGTSALPNGEGVKVIRSSNVHIGGSDEDANVISGNQTTGVRIEESTGTQLASNLIGMDAAGTHDAGNGRYGVYVQKSPNTSVGLDGLGNVISGNGSQYFDAGVFVFEPAVDAAGLQSTGDINIIDNRIGTNAACDAAIPNVNGIIFFDGPGVASFSAHDVLIDGNTISGNGGGPGPSSVEALTDSVNPAGSDNVSGDGIVWGAALPEHHVTISHNVVGTDCLSEPLPNQGDGALLGFAAKPASGPVSAQGDDLNVRVQGNDFSNNGEDCLQMDEFAAQFVPQTVLFFNALIDSISASDCVHDGVAVHQVAKPNASYETGSRIDISNVHANGNGGDGIDVESTGDAPDHGKVLPDTHIEDSEANDNHDHGVRHGPGYMGEDNQPPGIDPPDLTVDNTSASGNGAGGFIGQYNPEYIVVTGTGDATTQGGLPIARGSVTISNSSFFDNGGPGIEIIGGMAVGGVAQGPRPQSALPSGAAGVHNAIYGNAGPGIDLGGDGPTGNDMPDIDGRTNSPAVASVDTTGGIHITGSYDGAAGTGILLHFFSNVACSETRGPGEHFIGGEQVTTNAQGYADFDVTFPSTSPGAFISATATGPLGTSEFAGCMQGAGLTGRLGDTDCNDAIDGRDPLTSLIDLSGGTSAPCGYYADLNCDNARDSSDVVLALADLAAAPRARPGCGPIG